MMLCLWILLGTALTVDSYVNVEKERLAHGRQLSIRLPKQADKLEFTKDDDSTTYVLWEDRRGVRASRGKVTGFGSERRFIISHVTFDDQGTYTQRNFFDKETTVLKLKVVTKNDFIDRVAGEDLSISLIGITSHEASLTFSSEANNITLVLDGAPVGQDNPEYSGRIKVLSSSITVKSVNVSDEGTYRLMDKASRLVSVTRMKIVDEHENTGNPFLALLLLLGIPVGICCCCRKKIRRAVKSKASDPVYTAGPADTVHPPPPSYNTPSVTPPAPGTAGPVYYHNTGPVPSPNAGYSPGYPQGQVYPPPSPVPGQPQWNAQPGVPPNPALNPAYPPQNPVYPPVPQPQAAAPGYGPVMYSAPPISAEPVKEEIKMNEMAPAAPLLTPPKSEAVAPSAPSNDVLHSSDAVAEFKLEGTKYL